MYENEHMLHRIVSTFLSQQHVLLLAQHMYTVDSSRQVAHSIACEFIGELLVWVTVDLMAMLAM